MSIKVMSAVWDIAGVGGTHLLVLLAMADWANDEGGNIYPSIKTLAAKTRISESQARRIVQDLIANEIVELVEAGGWIDGQNAPNRYRIVLGNIKRKITARRGNSEPDGGGTSKLTPPRAGDSTVLAPVTPDPSVDPSVLQNTFPNGKVQVASATHSQPVPPPHTDGAAVCDEDPAAVQEAADEVLPLFASDGNVAQAHTQSAKSSATTRKKSDYAKKSTGYVNETTGVSTNDIRAAYYALLEQHEPGAVPNHGETGRSAKNLAQAGWTPDAIERCYADMKREPFYARKHVALVEIAKQIGARVGSVAPPQTKPAAPKLDGLRNESGRLLVVARVGLEERLKFMSDSEIPHSQARPATREDIDAAAAQKGLTAKDYMHLVLYYDGPLPE